MSLFTSVLNAFGADKAAKTQERAANNANALVKEQYDTTRADLAPYREAGTTALSRYRDLLGSNGQGAASAALEGYTKSPFLPQLVQDSTNAVEHSRAARGGLFSGGAMGEIGQKASNIYLGDYNNYLSRIGGMIDSGQNAAAQTGTFGANAAAQRADLTQQAGAYKAQQAVIPGAYYNQFVNNVADIAGKFVKPGAFG
jgi:hypothetical protein